MSTDPNREPSPVTNPVFPQSLAASQPTAAPPESDLDRLADTAQPSLAREFLDFLAENKKWWLLPILIVLGLFGVLALLASSSVAPFIYTLF